MLNDVNHLREFYASPLGKASVNSISMALSSLWGEGGRERTLGLGFCTPFLDRFSSDSKQVLNFSPAGQGALHWPQGKNSSTALVFEEELPLADSCIDRVIMVHLLEHSESPTETLREVWRVLAPNGKLFIIVPNRRGIWARFEHTPFGMGRPFSKGQLSRLLKSCMFSPSAWNDALHFAPGRTGNYPKMAAAMERAGRRFWPVFAGTLVVEAHKKLYQGIPAIERQSRRVFVPVLAPQGSAQNGSIRTAPVRRGKN